jgi:transcriptional regulator with XRE-family HTH domain
MAEKYPYVVVGKAIRDARLRKGLTQVGLAEKLGASRETIVNWERGQKRPERFYKELSETLGLDAGYLQLAGEVAAAREQTARAAERLRELEERLERHQAAPPRPLRRRDKRRQSP